jgi:fructose-1,6-bisphosphatase/inositol monophosphatase family enzyme
LPQAAIVSEELDNDSRLAERLGHTVVIDPIDGTENYTSGLPEWGISVSIYKQSRHACSLLLCPELNLSFATGMHIERAESRIRGLSSSLSKADVAALPEGFEFRILGCCVYNMINVVRGSFQSFENPRGARSWDILAGLNICLEHGLDVTVEGEKYAGQYLEPDKKYRFRIRQP